jgi:hypothetical protein
VNVTREVVADLWPVYAAGEASADSRALVDEFLKGDPEFAQVLKVDGADELIAADVPALSLSVEARALGRTKRVLHRFDWLFFAAIMFTCFAFGRIISDTSFDVSPRNFIITAAVAACFWIAFFGRTMWVLRRVYRTTMNSGA